MAPWIATTPVASGTVFNSAPGSSLSVSGAAVLISTSALASAGSVGTTGASALMSSSTLGSSAQVVELGSAALVSASTLATAATLVVAGAVALTSSSALTGVATVNELAAVALTSASTLLVLNSGASLVSSSTLGAGTVVTVGGGSALLSVSTLTASAQITAVASSALSSTSTLSATPSVSSFPAAALLGSSALVGAGLVTQNAAIALLATSSLLAAGSPTESGVAALASTSTFAVTGVVSRLASAALSSASTLVAQGLPSTHVYLLSVSALGVAGSPGIRAGAVLASTSSMSSSGNVTFVPPPTVVGSGVVLLSGSSMRAVVSQSGWTVLTSTSSMTSSAAVAEIVSVDTPIVLRSLSALGVGGGPETVALSSSSVLGNPNPPDSTVVTVVLLSVSTVGADVGKVFVLDRTGSGVTLTPFGTDVPTQPGVLNVSVGNGAANEVVSFTFDGNATVVSTALLDAAGSSSSINIPVSGLSVGSHTVIVTSNTGTSTAVSFTVASAPLGFTPLPGGTLPPAVPTVAVQRWTFQAYNFSDVNAVATYTLPYNPVKISQNFGEIKITSVPTTVVNGLSLSWEGNPVPTTWSWEGQVLTKADHDALVFWAGRNDRVWLTDEFLRRFLLKIESLSMIRRRDPDRPWHHKYVMTASYLAPVS